MLYSLKTANFAFVKTTKSVMRQAQTVDVPQLIVSIEDGEMINKIKSAIRMIQGVGKVTIRKRQKTGMELALEDVRKGRVTEWKNADEMFETLMKD